MRRKNKALAVILIFFLISFLASLALIEHRPVHHDEGVNGYFVSEITEEGKWGYDAENYHGPTLFYITAVSFLVFGNNVFALRFVPVLIGSLAVLIGWLYRKELGLKGLAVTSFVLALSPSMLYFSGFAIHEILFCVFLFASVSLFFKFVDTGTKWMLFAGSLSLALLMATKEAGLLIGLAVLLFAFAYAKASGNKCRDFVKEKQGILLAVLVFVLVYSALFTSFYSNWNGLEDSVSAISQWGPRIVQEPGHQKPFEYYLETLFFSETILPLIALAGFSFALWKKEKLIVGIGLFYLVFFVVVSLVPYKTPWIVVNFVPGMALLAGYLVKGLKKVNSRDYSALIWIAVVLLVLPVQAINLNYANPAGEDNRLAYVHTTEDSWQFIESAKNSGGKIFIAIGEHSTWPLPWYLRDEKVSYYGLDAAENVELLNEFDFIFVREEEGKNLGKKLEKFENQTFDLRPGTRLTVFWRAENEE